jgi:hypothetical protein
MKWPVERKTAIPLTRPHVEAGLELALATGGPRAGLRFRSDPAAPGDSEQETAVLWSGARVAFSFPPSPLDDGQVG